MTPHALTFFLALTGCGGDTTTDSGATVQDSGTTAQDSGTAGTTDTEPPDPTVAVAFTTPAGTESAGLVTLGLVRLYDTGGTLTVGDTLAAGDAGVDNVIFALPVDAPVEHQVEDPEHAGLMVATYAASAWVETTADGAFEEGQEIAVGADSDALVVFLSGTLPDGWPAGWSLADNHFADGDDAGDPTFSDLSGGALVEGLGLLDLSLSLGGSYQSFGGGGHGLVGLGVDEDGEADLDDPVFDVLLSGTTWDATRTAAPSADHQFYSVDAGGRIAIVGMVLYNDGDNNGEYTWFLELDADAHSACLMGAPVGLFFLGRSTSLGAILGLDIVGWQAGWMAFTGNPDAGEDLVRLTEAESTALAIGPNCTIE